MSRIVLVVFWVFGLLLVQEQSRAQNISGIINDYAHVVDIDTCFNTITVATTKGFSVGDRVLVIQIKGAVIDESNTSNYGDAGSSMNRQIVEIATIRSIPDGKTIRFVGKLINQYNVKGNVQIVRIPQYQNPIVTSTLTAKAWDAVSGTGGILILETTGSLTLNAPIDVSGLGFHGGQASDNGSVASELSYFCDPLLGVGGRKGEGIAIIDPNTNAGRGAPANGGGGGNSHNSGGGGGANLNTGGQGGDQSDAASFGRIPNGGMAGHRIGIIPSRGFFLGGGGGGGHQNDGGGSDGGNGGGIVIFVAKDIIATNGVIKANGSSAKSSRLDGAGGGGAGGVILIIASSLVGSCTVEVNGGDGGDADAANTFEGLGCGGGGSGGVIYVTNIPSLAIKASGGNAGRLINCTNPVINNTSYGASAGGPAAFPVTFVGFPENTSPFKYPSVDSHQLTICDGEVITITAQDADSYLWSPPSSFLDPTNPTQTTTPNTSTTYYITLTKGSCIFQDSVNVIVNPKPLVNISASTLVLQNPSDNSILSVPSGFASYRWSTGETSESISVSTPDKYIVTVTNANGCSSSDSIVIQAATIPASIDLGLPIIEAAPGDHVIIPISILSSQNMELSGATDFQFWIRFNRSLLDPVSPILASKSVGRERTIQVSGTRSNSLTIGTLTTIEFIAALGDTTETPIYIDSISWTNGQPVTTTFTNGTFRLLGVCPAGGNRLFSSEGKFLLNTPKPNPVQHFTKIEYSLLEEGNTTVYIVDMLGRIVQTIISGWQVPGDYHTIFDVSSLPNGLYHCVLKSPNQMHMNTMEVYH